MRQRVKGSPPPTGEPCQLELPGEESWALTRITLPESGYRETLGRGMNQVGELRDANAESYPSSRPYFRISGQVAATASTTRMVPTPPATMEKTVKGSVPEFCLSSIPWFRFPGPFHFHVPLPLFRRQQLRPGRVGQASPLP